MKRELLVSVLSLTLVVTSSSIVFAGETIDGQQIIVEHQANVVEEVVGTEDVCTDIEESRKEFSVEGETLDVEIPKDGDEAIVMESEDGEEIAMGLPEEAEKAEAVLTDDGTVVYDTTEDVSVAVQATQEMQGELILEGIRSMVIIENADAPREYSFNYDFPKGYEMIKSEDYSTSDETAEPGWIYIVDTENVFIDEETGETFKDIVAVIEPAWATDANGNDVNSYYRVSGNELIQIVEFDTDSKFPIVADPKTTKRPQNKMLTSITDTVTINNSTVSSLVTLAGFGKDVTKKGFKKAFEKYAKEELKGKLTKTLAKKGVKYTMAAVGVVLTAIDVYCAWQWLVNGKTYSNFKYRIEEWKMYKCQGGKWVAGYAYKVKITKIWAS